MALVRSKFQHLAGAGEGQVYMYNSPDTHAVIAASGYFNLVTDQIRQFDVILVVGSTGGTPTVEHLIVTSASSAAIVTTSAAEGAV